MKNRQQYRQRRHQHVRKTVSGNSDRPRLNVYRSNQHIYAQLIDDVAQKTLLSANDLKITKGNPQEKAKQVGQEIAEKAKAQEITKIVFDRGGYKFHGRVKSLAEGAREGGLDF